MNRLGHHLQPAAGAIFDVGIISLRLAAIMPVVGRRSRGRCHWRSLYDLWLLLDDNRGGRNGDDRGISRRPISVRRISAIPISRRPITIGRRIPIIGRVEPAIKPIPEAITSQ